MAPRPNILLILADDMGYSDLGCYGGAIETPNLDRLAASGVRFTHAYNSARCCPARAALLTGLYPHQAGMGWMTAANLGFDGYAGDLNTRCLTIAEALRLAGYGTYMSGKWHLTFNDYTKPGVNQNSWPRARGFERYYGLVTGGGSYFQPNSHILDDGPIPVPEGFYQTDAISDRACHFITEHRDPRGGRPNDPFFLYTAYTAPHWPLHAWPRDIAKYRGHFRAGWDVLRQQKYERMRAMGLLDGWALSPRDPEVPAWDSLSPEEQDEFDLRMAIYAAQVDCMDQGIGRIVQTLRTTGQLDNTIVFFLSDNGGCHEETHWASPDPRTFGTADSFESYGRPWANLSNVPFREFKSWVHEGGISTPLIVHWPAGVQDPGRLYHSPAHITDFMPTCLELAGTKYAPDPARHAWPLVGTSMTPCLAGRPMVRDCIFWEHEGNRALREGDWKLVAKGLHGPWELYDMRSDRTELHDLSSQQPQRVRIMAGKWQRIAQETQVFPLDGRGWGPRIEDPAGGKATTFGPQ